MDVEETYENVIREALSSGERRLLALFGRESERAAVGIVRRYAELSGRDVRLLVMGEEPLALQALLLASGLPGNVSVLGVPYRNAIKVLGGTWDILLMDVSEQFRPNDVGMLVEVVAGGGLVVFTAPPTERWLSSLTLFQRRLVTYPYTEKDVGNRLKKRFLRKVREHEGCWLLDLESGEVYGRRRVRAFREWRIGGLGGGVHGLAATKDQLDAVKAIEEMGMERGRRTTIVIASRGRGKSAAVGLGLASLVASMKRLRIAVTAPERTGVETLVEFFKRGLEALGVQYREYGDMIRAGKSRLFYMDAELMPRKRADIKVVDEAASMPVPLLNSIVHSSSYSIFSTTVHGYEGAGRGFSLRFLKNLREIKDLKVREVRLETPIRYPPGDPIESWLYSFLLLDAEPTKLDEADLSASPSDAVYYRPSKDELFDGGEGLLRDLYGIYVIAHYRNRPDDLGTLADAPHHFARALMLPGGKTVVSLQLAEEGGFTPQLVESMARREYEPSGHIIPHRVLIHHGNKVFPRLRGLRIVRIATHPSLMDRGFGSRALKELLSEAEERGYDWVGSGFGATEQLMRFWVRNGFIPIHLSPARNPVSGEHTVLVARPLNRRADKILRAVNSEFRRRLLGSLHDVYFDLDPRLALILLESGPEVRAKPNLSRGQRSRLRGYVEGWLSYEAASDAIAELFRAYLFSSDPEKPDLDRDVKALVVGKVFQGKRPAVLSKMLKIKAPYERVREAARRVYLYYESAG